MYSRHSFSFSFWTLPRTVHTSYLKTGHKNEKIKSFSFFRESLGKKFTWQKVRAAEKSNFFLSQLFFHFILNQTSYGNGKLVLNEDVRTSHINPFTMERRSKISRNYYVFFLCQNCKTLSLSNIKGRTLVIIPPSATHPLYYA